MRYLPPYSALPSQNNMRLDWPSYYGFGLLLCDYLSTANLDFLRARNHATSRQHKRQFGNPEDHWE